MSGNWKKSSIGKTIIQYDLLDTPEQEIYIGFGGKLDGRRISIKGMTVREENPGTREEGIYERYQLRIHTGVEVRLPLSEIDKLQKSDSLGIILTLGKPWWTKGLFYVARNRFGEVQLASARINPQTVHYVGSAATPTVHIGYTDSSSDEKYSKPSYMFALSLDSETQELVIKAPEFERDKVDNPESLGVTLQFSSTGTLEGRIAKSSESMPFELNKPCDP